VSFPAILLQIPINFPSDQSRRHFSVGTAQIARSLTDPFDGFLRTARYLIHDRGSAFTKEFASILKSTGVKTVKLPPRSPNLNARVLEEFVLHYHGERNHQGLDNAITAAFMLKLIGQESVKEDNSVEANSAV
jgi:inhibitor of KinA sporulation pathway (predicted exonuclease)